MAMAMRKSMIAVFIFRVVLSAQSGGKIEIYATWDDGPDTHTLALAKYLHGEEEASSTLVTLTKQPPVRSRPQARLQQAGSQPERPPVPSPGSTDTSVHGTFFINPCRLADDANRPSPWTGNCSPWPGKQDPGILAELVKLGHELGNHTMDHTMLTNSALTTTDLHYQLCTPQQWLSRYQRFFKPFRAPYLAWNDALTAFAKSDACVSELTGPFGCDYCGGGTIQGQVVGGDYDCLAKSFGVEVCGQLYINAIEYLSKSHTKIILLFHDRLQGNEGTDKALKLAQYLFPRLSRETYVFKSLSAYYPTREH